MPEPDLTKVADSIAEVVEPKSMECPHCHEKIFVQNVASIPNRQIFTMTLESQTGSFTARTVGETIANLDKLMKAIAKDIGGKVELFVDSLEKTDKMLRVGFLVTAVAQSMNSKKK